MDTIAPQSAIEKEVEDGQKCEMATVMSRQALSGWWYQLSVPTARPAVRRAKRGAGLILGPLAQQPRQLPPLKCSSADVEQL